MTSHRIYMPKCVFDTFYINEERLLAI